MRFAQSGVLRDSSLSVWDRNVRPSLSRASSFGKPGKLEEWVSMPPLLPSCLCKGLGGWVLVGSQSAGKDR